jgi:hypothetical protein
VLEEITEMKDELGITANNLTDQNEKVMKNTEYVIYLQQKKRSMWSNFQDARVRRKKTWSEAHTNTIGMLCRGAHHML